MRKWDDVTSDGLFTILTYLQQNFNRDLSLKVIELFHERMRDEVDFDPALLRLLIKRAFALIVEGYSADQALGLRSIRGKHQRPDTTSRDVRAAAIVILEMRNGKNWENAVMTAGEVLNVKERTIQNAYVSLRVALENLPDEVLLVAAAEPKPDSESEQG